MENTLIKDAPIAAEAANGMMPGTVKVVGPEADEEKIKAYLRSMKVVIDDEDYEDMDEMEVDDDDMPF